jgi:hypothetical protein
MPPHWRSTLPGDVNDCTTTFQSVAVDAPGADLLTSTLSPASRWHSPPTFFPSTRAVVQITYAPGFATGRLAIVEKVSADLGTTGPSTDREKVSLPARTCPVSKSLAFSEPLMT